MDARREHISRDALNSRAGIDPGGIRLWKAKDCGNIYPGAVIPWGIHISPGNIPPWQIPAPGTIVLRTEVRLKSENKLGYTN